MRNIQSANSKVDAYEQGDLTALSNEELAGRSLFYSDSLSCSKCHQPPLYTSLRFENTGLYLHYEDLGRRRVTVGVLDDGKFKVPTLRNVAETAPYMHNGSINSLEEVLAHYESGGQAHPQKSRLIKGFHLTTNQRQQLISFKRL
jgi:cytochrome c peroxidase